jgi:hypothetical protein
VRIPGVEEYYFQIREVLSVNQQTAAEMFVEQVPMAAC